MARKDSIGISFSEYFGDVDLLKFSNFLLGEGATVSVTEIVRGNELGGFLTLQFGSETADLIPFNVDAQTLRSNLESLKGVGRVDVDANNILDSEQGRSFAITFLVAERGDVPLLVADTSDLTGFGAAVTVAEVVKGSVSSKNAFSELRCTAKLLNLGRRTTLLW